MKTLLFPTFGYDFPKLIVVYPVNYKCFNKTEETGNGAVAPTWTIHEYNFLQVHNTPTTSPVVKVSYNRHYIKPVTCCKLIFLNNFNNMLIKAKQWCIIFISCISIKATITQLGLLSRGSHSSVSQW